MADFPQIPQPNADRVVSLQGGANQRLQPWLLPDGSAEWVENLEVDIIGKRTQRRGALAFGAAGGDPGGLSGYSDENFDEFLSAIWGSLIYKSEGDGGWAQIASDVSLIPNLLHQVVNSRHNAELAMAVAACEEVTETTLGINGRSQLVIYSIESDVATQVSLAPRAITAFQNRLFYAENETLGWSEIGDLAQYSDANTLTVEAGVGGRITTLVPSRDDSPKMWIFKETAVLLFTPRWGTDSALIPAAGDALDTINSSIRLLTQGSGCIATKSAQWVPGDTTADLFFLATDGVRSLQRAENDVQIGAGFPLTYNIPAWVDRINFAEAHKATAAVFDNAYHLAVPLDGAKDNTHVLRYDIANKAWTLHSWQGRDLGTFRIGGDERLFMQNLFGTVDTSVTGLASDPVSQVYQLYRGSIDPSTDGSEPVRVVPREESKASTFQELIVRKNWDRFSFQVSSGETSRMEIAYRRDLGAWNTLTETVIPGSLSTIVLGQDPLPWQSTEDVARARSISLRDIGPSYNLQIRIGGVTGATESGRWSVLMSEIVGHALANKYRTDT